MITNLPVAPSPETCSGLQTSVRNPAIDGIRGLFAALVFLAHFHVQFHLLTHNHGVLYFTSATLWCITRAAVGIFFALSGFLFYGSLLKRPEPCLPFFVKRLRRLYPAFLFAFTLYLLFCLMFPSTSKLPATGEAKLLYIGANLLMLQGLLHPPMIVQSWTLTFTCAFYLAVPAVVWGFRKLNFERKQRLLCLVGLWLLALGSIPFSGVMTNGIGFITGMIVAESLPWLRTKTAVTGRRAELLAGLLVAAACGMLYVGFSWHAQFLDKPMPAELFTFYAVACRVAVLSLTTMVIFVLALAGNGPTRGILGFGPLAALGTFSYSWYLMHGIALKLTGYLVERALAAWHMEPSLLFVPALLVSLLFAWAISLATYHLIENRSLLAGRALKPAAGDLTVVRVDAR
jgi:exopolysaccharide production protein ExoZ